MDVQIFSRADAGQGKAVRRLRKSINASSNFVDRGSAQERDYYAEEFDSRHRQNQKVAIAQGSFTCRPSEGQQKRTNFYLILHGGEVEKENPRFRGGPSRGEDFQKMGGGSRLSRGGGYFCKASVGGAEKSHRPPRSSSSDSDGRGPKSQGAES